MDINAHIAKIKELPDFAQNVGMILSHYGVVRAWSRKDGATVGQLRVQVDQAKVESIRQEIQAREGIFHVVIEAHSGEFNPGDDLMLLVVAGDIRENVKPALANLLDRIKAEAVCKEELAGCK